MSNNQTQGADTTGTATSTQRWEEDEALAAWVEERIRLAERRTRR